MNARERRNEIRQEKIGTQDKYVLLVEGTDDKHALEILLSRFMPGWENRWTVEAAGKKAMVPAILALEPDWLGLVDRDEWDIAEQQRHMEQNLGLMVLPRFCMENYLIVPTELWPAIPPQRQTRVNGGLEEFQQRLSQDLPRYVRHGVLWHIVTPLWSGLRALGFKKKLASDSPDCIEAAQSDEEIRQVLQDWDDFLNPDRLLDTFRQKLQEVQSLSIEEQLRDWVHGKTYWAHKVNPEMNRLFGQMGEKKRRQKLWQHFPACPTDLQPLIERLQEHAR